MDYQKRLQEAKYKVDRGIKGFDEAEDPDRKEYFIKQVEMGLQEIKMIQSRLFFKRRQPS
jgi:hypothetical protein